MTPAAIKAILLETMKPLIDGAKATIQMDIDELMQGRRIVRELTSESWQELDPQAFQVDAKKIQTAWSQVAPQYEYPRSLEQSKLISLGTSSHHVAGILPTASGKTMAYLLPSAPVFQTQKIPPLTIVGVPHRSIKQNVLRDTQSLNLNISGWSPEMDPHDPTVDVIIVVFDTLLSEKFLQWCILVQIFRMIARFVLDEAHLLILESTWRVALRNPNPLRLISAKITLLMALVTAQMFDLLKAELGIFSDVLILKAPSHRPEIRYSVRYAPKGVHGTQSKVVKPLLTMIKAILIDMTPEDRALIYVFNRAQGNMIAGDLEAHIHHTEITPDKCLENATAFDKGEGSRIMVATQGFGTGIDVKSVRFVILIGFPSHLFDYAQMCQRAGRDGLPSEAILIAPGEASWDLAQVPADDIGLRKNMIVNLMDPTKCIREVLGGAFDGAAIGCHAYDGKTIRCSRCGNMKSNTEKRTIAKAKAAAPLPKAPSKVISSGSDKAGWKQTPANPLSSRHLVANTSLDLVPKNLVINGPVYIIESRETTHDRERHLRLKAGKRGCDISVTPCLEPQDEDATKRKVHSPVEGKAAASSGKKRQRVGLEFDFELESSLSKAPKTASTPVPPSKDCHDCCQAISASGITS